MKSKVVVALAVLALAIGAGGCTGKQFEQAHQVIVQQAVYPAFSTEEKARLAASIVKASVVEVLPSKWDTPDGLEPADPRGHIIYTDAKMSVLQAWKGQIAVGNTITVRLLGGTVGTITMSAEDEVSVKPGEVVYLLLGQLPNNRQSDTWNIWHQGKFVRLENGLLTNGVTTMSPDEFAKLASSAR